MATNDESDEKYRFPLGVTADEEGDFVRVCIVVRGIKKKGITSGGDKRQPANGNLKVDLEERKLDVIIELDLGGKDKNGKNKIEKFRYQVKQLPDSVDPKQSSYKVKKDQIILLLKKEKARSWSRELSTGGLETFREASSDESDREEQAMEAETLGTIQE